MHGANELNDARRKFIRGLFHANGGSKPNATVTFTLATGRALILGQHFPRRDVHAGPAVAACGLRNAAVEPARQAKDVAPAHGIAGPAVVGKQAAEYLDAVVKGVGVRGWLAVAVGIAGEPTANLLGVGTPDAGDGGLAEAKVRNRRGGAEPAGLEDLLGLVGPD